MKKDEAKEILCKQMELLAEASKTAKTEELSRITTAMLAIYAELYKFD